MIHIAFAFCLAILPSFIKIPLYRQLFHYRIGRDVRIGITPFVHIRDCEIADGAHIGHFNLMYRIEHLEIGAHSQIGFLNLFRGGQSIVLGRYVTILRQNTFNSILDRDFVEPAEATLELGDGAFISAGHWLDFSHHIKIGAHSILGGRNSSLWTHNRQRARPIEIGSHVYLGSEIRVAPGVKVSAYCVISLGTVLTGQFECERVLIGGNPGSVLRPLNAQDLYLVVRKTRNDIPDELAYGDLPPDLKQAIEATPE